MSCVRIGWSLLLVGAVAVAEAGCLGEPGKFGPGDDPLVGDGNVAPVASTSVVSNQPGAEAGPATDGCTNLGSLNGTAFTADFKESAQGFWASISGRPEKTKIGIIGVGTAMDLKGHSVELGTGANASYATCTHCLPLAVGCVEDDCSMAKWYFPTSGSAVFTDMATSPGGSFEGSFSNVVLSEVSIAANNESTPVVGGGCIRFNTVTFRATIPVADAGKQPSGDAGVADSEPGTDPDGGAADDSGADADGGSTSSGTGHDPGDPRTRDSGLGSLDSDAGNTF